MAILGIGTDLVKISRIKRLVDKYQTGFAERILHQNELQIFMAHPSPEMFLAKRFAAKEATAKALGTGIAKGVSFQDIEVANNDTGQPQLLLHGIASQMAQKMGMTQCFVSLTDEEHYAIAYVIIEK